MTLIIWLDQPTEAVESPLSTQDHLNTRTGQSDATVKVMEAEQTDAEKTWMLHKLQNDSIICQTFQGLLQSTEFL